MSTEPETVDGEAEGTPWVQGCRLGTQAAAQRFDCVIKASFTPMSYARTVALAGVIALATSTAWAQAPAQPPSTAMTVYGPGSVSCATYLQDRTLRINADGWILGFWTGMNEEDQTNHQVGKTTDARGIVAQVAQICRAQPVAPLYKTVRDIYKQMKSDGS